MRLGDRLDGHLVQGHVDGVGRVAAARPEGESTVLEITAPPDLLRYVVEKGSIAVDGVSLTVAGAAPGRRSPSPSSPTRWPSRPSDRRPWGAPVNLEVDVVAKYVESLASALRAAPGGTRMTSSTAQFATVAEAIEEIRAGRMVVILDSEDRENEGDLVMAAQFATPEAINFMATHGARADLPGAHRGPLRPARPEARWCGATRRPTRTAFTEPIEARARHHDRHLGRRTARARSWWRSTRRPGPRTSSSPGTCSRCGPSRAACWSAPATPRRRSTSRASRGSSPPG